MPPAPFLLGIALIFWGWMTDRMWVAAGCALLIEAGRYSRIRWPFSQVAFVRAWRLSIFAMVITLALVLMQRADVRAMARVFSWLPVILLPLQFVQSYGTSPVMGLGTFSLMVRRRRVHAEKFSLPFHETYFSFGRVYLTGILISSALGVNSSSPFFFPLMVGIIGWGLMSTRSFSWAYLPVVLCLSLIPAAGAAFAGGQGLMKLYTRLINSGNSSQGANDRSRTTSMGDLGEIKLSAEILWRVRPLQGLSPRLLRLSSYQNYLNGRWNNETPPDARSLEADYRQLPEVQNPDNPDDPEDKFVQCSAGGGNLELVRSHLPRFHLLGNFPVKGLIPVPGSATAFHNVNLYTDLDMNSMGGVRFDPVDPLVDADVLWNSDAYSTERPPWQRTQAGKNGYSWPDLEIPRKEQQTIAAVAADLKLSEGSLREKIERLRGYFAEHYRYTLYNETPKVMNEGSTYIATFLTDTHRGHCEYFATATALLLRQAGVPTRYTSGFAVAEFDSSRKEYLIRGVHAHAWCRAWDAANRQWIDVDLTPPDWLKREPDQRKLLQPFLDWWKINQETFLAWRSKPGRMAIITACLVAPVIIALLIIARILWRSRQKIGNARALRRGATVLATPLSGLERPARRVLGHRPDGRPLAAWLTGLSGLLEKPELLGEALDLHQRARFDPAAPADLQARLAALTRQLKAMIKRLPKKAG
ncbi:MAG: hypothetical protein JWO82_4254 [Akkermansiaceae bacterium]|nr:hypothetical protein [Akkermansiaceae bacterium]